MPMNLYYAEWPDRSVTILHAPDSFEAYHMLDQEGDPESAKVWTTNNPAAIITVMGPHFTMSVHRDMDYRWARVLMPKFQDVYGRDSCL